jgi:pimeloyl-ACP methyl ester carboxylesterase
MFKAAALVALALACLGSGCSGQEETPASRGRPHFEAGVRFLDIGSSRIAYYRRGSGRPLLMMTGTGSTMSEWDPALIRLLARGNRLILFDYPGIGLSSGRGPGSFASIADEVASFIDQLGLKRPDVLGWSMGGFVAQQLAIRHPGKLHRLVLAGTNPGGDRAVLGPRWVRQIDSHAESDRAALKLLYPMNRRGRLEGRRFLGRLVRSSERGEIPADFRVREESRARQVGAEDGWLKGNRNWNRLGELSIPALVAAGRSDLTTPPGNARRLASRIPKARLQLFNGAHAFLFSARHRFARVLQGFLN